MLYMDHRVYVTCLSQRLKLQADLAGYVKREKRETYAHESAAYHILLRSSRAFVEAPYHLVGLKNLARTLLTKLQGFLRSSHGQVLEYSTASSIGGLAQLVASCTVVATS